MRKLTKEQRELTQNERETAEAIAKVLEPGYLERMLEGIRVIVKERDEARRQLAIHQGALAEALDDVTDANTKLAVAREALFVFEDLLGHEDQAVHEAARMLEAAHLYILVKIGGNDA